MLRAEVRRERNDVAATQYARYATVAGARAITAGDAARNLVFFQTVSNARSIARSAWLSSYLSSQSHSSDLIPFLGRRVSVCGLDLLLRVVPDMWADVY